MSITNDTNDTKNMNALYNLKNEKHPCKNGSFIKVTEFSLQLY